MVRRRTGIISCKALQETMAFAALTQRHSFEVKKKSWVHISSVSYCHCRYCLLWRVTLNFAAEDIQTLKVIWFGTKTLNWPLPNNIYVFNRLLNDNSWETLQINKDTFWSLLYRYKFGATSMKLAEVLWVY